MAPNLLLLGNLPVRARDYWSRISGLGQFVKGGYQEVMTAAGHKDFNFSSLEGYIVAKVMVESSSARAEH